MMNNNNHFQDIPSLVLLLYVLFTKSSSLTSSDAGSCFTLSANSLRALSEDRHFCLKAYHRSSCRTHCLHTRDGSPSSTLTWNIAVILVSVYHNAWQKEIGRKLHIVKPSDSPRFYKNTRHPFVKLFQNVNDFVFGLDDRGPLLRNLLDVLPTSVCSIFGSGPSSTLQHCSRKEGQQKKGAGLQPCWSHHPWSPSSTSSSLGYCCRCCWGSLYSSVE